MDAYNIFDSFNKSRAAQDATNLAGLTQATGVATLAGHLQKLQQEKKLRETLASLGSDATPDQISAAVRSFASASEIFKSSTDSETQRLSREATKESARARLQQAEAIHNQDYQVKLRNATTAEQKAAVDAWDKQVRAQIAGERLKYDTGATVPVAPPALQSQLGPQAAPAAPTGNVSVAPTVTVAELMRLPPADRAAAMGALQTGNSAPPTAQTPPVAAPVAAPTPTAPVATPVAPASVSGAPAPLPTASVVAPKAIPAMPPEIAALPKRKQDEWTAAQGKSNAGSIGNRESVFINRVILSGNEAARDLENVVKLPLSTASRGLLGGRGQAEGIFNAGKETLANAMTSQEVQSYNVLATGFQRSLAAIEASGLAPSGALSNQMDAVIFKAGDTNYTKLQKLAQTRQIVEAGLETIIANPRVPQETRDHVTGIIKKIEKSVPFTQADLIALQQAQQVNPKITLQDVMKLTKKSGGGAAPAGVEQKVWDAMPEADRKLWQN